MPMNSKREKETGMTRSLSVMGRLGFGTAILIALAAFGGFISAQLAPAPAAAAVSLYDEDTVVGLYEQTVPAVAEISVTQSGRRFGGSGTGTGFLVDSTGLVLTNNHVIDGAGTIRVTFPGGSALNAELVATRRQDDLALLRVDPDEIANITPLPFGDSDLVKPGQLSLALGSPFGFESSISLGIVSGTDRTFRGSSSVMRGLLQTDAALNPGNSGGPLINSDGEVIGVNTAVEGGATSANGVGLAVASSTAIAFIDGHLASDPTDTETEATESDRAWLGISGMSVDAAAAEILGIGTETGVYVINVASGSPADEAGLQGATRRGPDGVRLGGDVIVAFDDVTIDGFEELVEAMDSSAPEDSIRLTVVRDEETIELTVELGSWPS